MYELYNQYVAELHKSQKYRTLSDTSQVDKALDFSTNDYLSLSKNQEVIEAAINGAKAYGVGATGSRLLSGNSSLHQTLEKRISQDKNTEASLIFNSGFQANLSTLSAILDPKVLKTRALVFFDKLNHSSLYQAIFLSSSELVRYNHNDMRHLELLLDKYKDAARPKFIVTETIFGMDGDTLDIAKIVSISEKYNAFLYLDEAHATGVFGHSGYGLSTLENLNNIPHIIMGTFSKALGCSGGYVACSNEIKEFLINKASGFIYSTAISPPIVAAVLKAWELLPSFHSEREKLMHHGEILRKALVKIGFDVGNSNTHIIPIILKKEDFTLEVREKLREKDILVSAIRPPTVPPNSSRLRIALAAHHSEQDLEKFINVLEKLL